MIPPSAPDTCLAPPDQKRRSFGDLRTRIVTALIIAALAIGALIAGGTIFCLFWLVAALAMYWEWQTMIGGKSRILRIMAGITGLSLAGGIAANLLLEEAFVIIVITALIIGLIAQSGLRLWSAGGVLYAGIFLIAIYGIRPPIPAEFEPKENICDILWLFAVVWGTDVMAYFGGRIIGGPKLWPRVSAGKTWSGAIIGVISGALLGLLVVRLYPFMLQPAWPALFLCGLAGGTAAQLGDLLESSIKRRFGVKDSSQLLPGHGGVMDRLDGFWAASIFLLVLAVVRDAPAIAKGLFLWG